MVRIADYIAQYLRNVGVTDVFMLTGGGAMHLNDAFGNCEGLRVICNHHEQASAIAAEGYARATGKLAVVNVTTGPGGLNTLTGVMGQWTDSVPVLYISGQVRYDTTIYAYPSLGLRQIGDQEICIVDVVKPITKFAAVLTDPADVEIVLARAIHAATSGRPGPAWIDVPMNVQGARIEPDKIRRPSPGDLRSTRASAPDADVEAAVRMLREAKRPALIAGHGIRLANARPAFSGLLADLRVPILSTFNGFDLIPTNDPLAIGRIGTIGNRSANFVLQNADLLLCLGTRNNIRQISYDWRKFGRSAKKIVVDVDKAELEKPSIVPDLAIHACLSTFLPALHERLKREAVPDWSDWIAWCQERRHRFPTWVAPNADADAVDPYHFCRILSEEMPEDALLITGNATPSIAYFQSAVVKRNHRIIWNSGCAAMGYDLPAAIGACMGRGKQETVCLAGDGSLQLNIQELATIAYHKLPVKVFCFSNNGYISIKQTQDNFFPGRRVGTDSATGVGLPDYLRVAAAYDIQTATIDDSNNLRERIRHILSTNGPVFCRLQLRPDYIFSPKLSSERKPDGRMVSKPLEDMFPFLDREEFRANMIVPPLEE